MSVFIIWRFGLPGVGFVALFEATKFYFMGSLFLAESLLVYPLVYVFGLAWNKLTERKLSSFDYILSGIFAWFIIFLREPVFLVTIFLYAIVLFGKKMKKIKVLSFGIFALLSFLTLLFTSVPDYIFQVVVMNGKTIFLSEVKSYGNILFGLFKIFFYPVVILIDGKWTFMREILVGMAILFMTLLAIFLLKSKKKFIGVLLLALLGFANVRVVPPGFMFYEAFHMLPWYGVFIISTFLLLETVYGWRKIRRLANVLLLLAIVIVAYAIFSPKTFLRERGDKDKEFHGNFDHYYIYGEAIKYLAKPGDTLFLEQWDDLIYWQAGLDSSYRYAIYGGTSKLFPRLLEERAKMFKEDPPTFYYSPCRNGVHMFDFLPEAMEDEYTQLTYVNRHSCLYVKRQRLKEAAPDVWEKLNVLRFYPPNRQ